MRLTRCHVDMPLHPGQVLQLPESSGNHLARVLRLRQGDACVLFNGDGNDYAATLEQVGKREVSARITAVTRADNESTLHITLIQGVARGDKMDLILQKATELGVSSLLPVMAERSEVKLDAERAEKRLRHWRNVVVSACEQSGRALLPQLSAPQSLVSAGEQCGPGIKLTLDPLGQQRLGGLTLPTDARVVIAIGPEGGWSPRDRDTLAAAGFKGLQLGPRILRTETAGLAAIAALQAHYGDMR